MALDRHQGRTGKGGLGAQIARNTGPVLEYQDTSPRSDGRHAPLYRRLAPELLANSNALGTDTGTYAAFIDAISDFFEE